MTSLATVEIIPDPTDASSTSPEPEPAPSLTLDNSLPSPSPPSSQPSSLGCQEIIPKPCNQTRTFTHYILPCDRDEYDAVTTLLRNMMGKFLDVSRPWKNQDKADIAALISAVKSSGSSTFDKYEDSWPISYYCYHYFHRARSKAKSPDQKRGWPGKCPRQRVVGSQPASPKAAMRKEALREKENMCPTASTSLGDEQQGTIQFEQTLPETTSSDNSPSGANNECRSNLWLRNNGEQEVLDFLLSINRTLGYLLDRFVTAGIQSKAQLLAAAQWPREERDVFFRTEVRLSPFEWKIVRDRLDKIPL